jgi:hypothetical protein
MEMASAERKPSFDEWLAEWFASVSSFRDSDETVTGLSVETLDAFVQECERRARALPAGKESHKLWRAKDFLKFFWFVRKHPECVRPLPPPHRGVDLLPSKVLESVEALEDYVNVGSGAEGFHSGRIIHARVKLEVMKYPERVRKLPDGRVLLLDPGYKGCGQIYSPDLNEWAGDVFTPEDGPDYKTPEPRPSWMRETPVPIPERFRKLVQNAAAAPTLSETVDRGEDASRAAGLALATSVGEARYDTNEQLRDAWARHMLSQNIHCAFEEARQRFLDAYAIWKTQGIGMLNVADAAFFQTYAAAYRLSRANG